MSWRGVPQQSASPVRLGFSRIWMALPSQQRAWVGRGQAAEHVLDLFCVSICGWGEGREVL